MLKTLFSTLVLATVSAGSASAEPIAAARGVDAPIVLAANGCGPGFFRTITGFCERNARVIVRPGVAVNAGPPCPRGYRRDPNPRRPLCYPVY